jgi:ribosomal protein S18 acetylase RimI-like enzyme
MRDPVELCAEASAGWHAAWLQALGLRWEKSRDVWRALDRPPQIYFAAITLRASTGDDAAVTSLGAVCDNWQTLTLARRGFRVWRTEPWFLRPPSALPPDRPNDLELLRVTTEPEVEEFEAVSVRGFEHEDATVTPGRFHPPSILSNDRMVMVIGRSGGRAVGAAMGYRTDNAVGVFGVTVVESARRRGYGTALTRAVLLPETGLPAVLAPSPEGAPLYEQLGFSRVGALSIWTRD